MHHVLGDIYVEATVTAATNHASTFKVHSKVAHFGTDPYANALQEFPAVYVNGVSAVHAIRAIRGRRSLEYQENQAGRLSAASMFYSKHLKAFSSIS